MPMKLYYITFLATYNNFARVYCYDRIWTLQQDLFEKAL